ncbi:MAG: zinc ribbon domain-containing protein [Verrucomicrobiota bacterium]|nr:zinc-ribbon domain-containing protein [Verrucomicrobiota bacterium]MDE3066250.1 zinc ribbon domain-containing protein [Verrucomicrobiota bacterium]
MPPEVCPNCGAEVPPGARACPECGADEETGWSEKAYADNLGLPDEQFDYGEFVNEEFGAGRKKPHGISRFWWTLALLLVVLLLLALLSGIVYF